MNGDALQTILDRQSIRETLFRHCVCLDEGNLSGLDLVWAQDCRRDNGDGGADIVGRDAMVAVISRSLANFKWTHHQLGDSLIEIDGDLATAMTYGASWHQLASGERCWLTARYHDELRRADGGRWLITYRRMVVTGAEPPLDGPGAIWLKRLVDK